MRTPKALSPRMTELLASYALANGNDIIASGPWVAEPGSFPFRVVLRERSTDFVVHTQSLDSQAGRLDFYWGDYFPRTGRHTATAFAKAWDKFMDRANHSVGSPPILEDCDVS